MQLFKIACEPLFYSCNRNVTLTVSQSFYILMDWRLNLQCHIKTFLNVTSWISSPVTTLRKRGSMERKHDVFSKYLQVFAEYTEVRQPLNFLLPSKIDVIKIQPFMFQVCRFFHFIVWSKKCPLNVWIWRAAISFHTHFCF